MTPTRRRAAPLVAAVVAAGLLAAGARPASACTTFLLRRGEASVVGKSYDWDQGAGLVLVNKRGVAKRALMPKPGEKPAEWVSRYASVTFNQYGRELPNGGMNEAGLVVEIMWLDESVPPPRDARPAVSELQLIQYLLDRHGTVAEVVRAVADVRVSAIYAKVHYLVCDRGGACAAIEHLGGKLVVTHGAALVAPTLTNDTYPASAAHLARHAGFGGQAAVPADRGSLSRFVRATALARQAGAPARRGPAALPATEAAFSILDSVSQGDYSKWNIVYEPAAGRVSFRTRARPRIKTVDLGRFDADCASPVKMLDIDADLEGDVTAAFQDYTEAANLALVRRTLEPMKASLPPGVLALLARYPSLQRCAAARPAGTTKPAAPAGTTKPAAPAGTTKPAKPAAPAAPAPGR